MISYHWCVIERVQQSAENGENYAIKWNFFGLVK